MQAKKTSGETVELTEDERVCYEKIAQSEGVWIDSKSKDYKTILSLRNKGLITVSMFKDGGATNPLDGYPIEE